MKQTSNVWLPHLHLRFQTISKDLGFDYNNLYGCFQGRNAHEFLPIHVSYKRTRIAKPKFSLRFSGKDGGLLFPRAKCGLEACLHN